jgi:hypothetical protein
MIRSIPILSSSPWIRGAPHNGFAMFIRGSTSGVVQASRQACGLHSLIQAGLLEFTFEAVVVFGA